MTSKPRHRWIDTSFISLVLVGALVPMLIITASRASGLGGDVAQHDRILRGIINSGLLLSIVALLFGLVGTAERRPLRWLAPLAAIVMVVVWGVLGKLGLLWFLTGAHE